MESDNLEMHPDDVLTKEERFMVAMTGEDAITAQMLKRTFNEIYRIFLVLGSLQNE